MKKESVRKLARLERTPRDKGVAVTIRIRKYDNGLWDVHAGGPGNVCPCRTALEAANIAGSIISLLDEADVPQHRDRATA